MPLLHLFVHLLLDDIAVLVEVESISLPLHIHAVDLDLHIMLCLDTENILQKFNVNEKFNAMRVSYFWRAKVPKQILISDPFNTYITLKPYHPVTRTLIAVGHSRRMRVTAFTSTHV